MKVEKGDYVGGFYDNGCVSGFIYGEVCRVDETKSKYLISGMRGKAKHSGDWWVHEKEILIHIKSVYTQYCSSLPVETSQTKPRPPPPCNPPKGSRVGHLCGDVITVPPPPDQ